jgi:predicted enzyme related to lactoylglutathione lyase
MTRRDLTLGAAGAGLAAAGLASAAPTQAAASDNDLRIDYIEVAVKDVARAKAFYQTAFGWKFTDYGPDYASFEDGRITGGFTSDFPVKPGATLLVLHAHDLAKAQASIEAAGGVIVKPVFAFPGGHRFHFTDPDGYELAVWSA